MPPDDLPGLATFDARLFEPPPWASARLQGSQPQQDLDAEPHEDQTVSDHTVNDEGQPDAPEVEIDDEGHTQFTTDELEKLLSTATALKDAGNQHFLAKPQRVDAAREAYLAALDHLPSVPARQQMPTAASAVVEISDEKALHLERESQINNDARVAAEEEIRSCTKAVWGNLGAVYLSTKQFKEAVDACTEALKLDANYVKALHRRATANEQIGTWAALQAAQNDLVNLEKLLPRTSPLLPGIRLSLQTLPGRISVQQEKEKDEMLSKLKDLGNTVLGKFGLSTDMFKFDQQPGGGYNLSFQS